MVLYKYVYYILLLLLFIITGLTHIQGSTHSEKHRQATESERERNPRFVLYRTPTSITTVCGNVELFVI